MADAAVEFLLENLKQLLLYHANLIQDAKNQVEDLEKDLRLFKAFLKDSTKNRSKDETVKVLAADKKSSNYFKKFVRTPANLISVAKDVEKIRAKVKSILDRDRVDLANRETNPSEREAAEEIIKIPKVREDNIVGFDDEAKTIITYLMEESEELDVISIIGLPGLGKTTLAGKIFRDPKIQFEFPTRIWVYVSQEFKRRDVYVAILSKFINNTDNLKHKSDQEITQLLQDHLQKGRFLIVMDDVWSADAWIYLRDALPKSNKSGKILITSRTEEVALEANRNRHPYKLRFLTFEESFLLLQLEVFGRPGCPQDLETFGQLIVMKCGGLPLAIVVIGGILVKRSLSGDPMARRHTWRKVSESVPTYLKEDPNVESIIALSYNKLPYYLRPCFLYLGMFPEDFEIPVWTLTRLWIAEGFIQQKTGITLEQTAQDYLEELVNRNLVMVDKMSTDGKIKSCRVHDTLRQFCKNESSSERENFLQEVKRTAGGGFEPSNTNIESYRRLCIHSSIVDFISSPLLFGPRVRSILCSSKEEPFPLPLENASSIPTAFKLLRILDAKSIIFTKFPRDMAHLVHLRYIVLSSNFKVIPEAIAELWNLQTLVVYTSVRVLEIKANIWRMLQLRHVKTNASAILPKRGKTTKELGEKLQTLGTVSPQSFTDDVFDRLRSLRKLGIRGLLVSLLDAKGMDKLDNLEKLKLVNDLYSSPSSGGRLPRLPEPYRFPPKLRSLTLCSTYLDWVHMSTLGMLDTLEVLKLKENAFVGKCWEVSTGHFRHLEVLHIERTDLGVWKAEANHFPRLECLVLRNCEVLQMIPYKLSEVQSFQRLDLKRVTKSAAADARKIEEAKNRQQDQELDANKRIKFRLYIAPGDE
ncbi:putative late blight resistance protein homolog R1B-16 isoform X2 [Andrographis paniculata]|uniref:putative late blight resistance protein homolog R1B-16 isoform X2 n=1 Tax=Andrographis paniculata TaxID=175694 RepID=UPI0021E9A278|nr:putative late blight resistance protein homolog R1B-16 isoform X2 [Andrographis paniculata]